MNKLTRRKTSKVMEEEMHERDLHEEAWKNRENGKKM